MRFVSAIALCSLLTLGLAGCGQKGPLYLPQDGKPVESQSAE